MRALESDAVAEVHDGVINGIRMAGHVKPCRAWGQLFKNGNLHTAQLYSAIVHPHSSHTLPFFLLPFFLLPSFLIILPPIIHLFVGPTFAFPPSNNKNISNF